MTEANPPDADLADRLKSGDPQALAALFDRHRHRLWRLVNFRMDRRLTGRVDPDDVLQEAYLAAAKRVEQFAREPFASPFLWLRLIVQQTLISVHRLHLGAQARDARREVGLAGLQYPQATSTSLAIQLAGDWTSPSQAAARQEAVAAVRQAVELMDPIDQEILALRHFEELTNGEVAAVLNIQEKAASIRYIRAIDRLRRNMATVPGLAGEIKHD